MNKLFTVLLIFVFVLSAKAQTRHIDKPQAQLYGLIDIADLTMKNCDFEKDANAMVLFDEEKLTFDGYNQLITVVRHKRIKIFNTKGKDEANITIPYIDHIADIEAETINLNGNTIEYTPVDNKLFYKEKIDKEQKVLVFTYPNVRAGSVIELQYKWKIFSGLVPGWYFQSDIPTRYSAIDATIPVDVMIDPISWVNQPFLKDTDIELGSKNNYKGKESIRALANVHSYKQEPFMTPMYDNLQRLSFKEFLSFWGKVDKELLNDVDFGNQLDNELTNESEILTNVNSIKDADSLATRDRRIDSIFKYVKNRMTWNKTDHWFTIDGTKKAWDKKTGNSTEINLILYHLLMQAGIQAYPMVVSTPDNGVVDPNDASLSQFNKTVVYIPLDSVNYYVLDATEKKNTYNEIPFDLLSTYGLAIAPKTSRYSLFIIQSDKPAKQMVYVQANIIPGGKMSGTAEIISDSYNKANSIKLYKDLGEKKYIDHLTDNDNNLKISSLKLESMETDTLPLTQHVNFDLNLTASDENYIYFNPNLFTSFGTNPFLNEERYSNIDFTYNNIYIISGVYKIPDGYKVDVLPKNSILTMEDKDISFKRIIGEQDGSILVRYLINRKRSYYKKEEYPGLFKFYKQMFEMLNEQVVLKKS